MVTLEVKVEQSSDLRVEWSSEMGVERSSNLKVGWNLEQRKCEMGHPLTAPMPNGPPVSFLDIILTPAYLSILEA